ncbi:hypothetical protein [Botrimarina hoheduenensis]|uniref:Lipoprotein n=1 Tax=Botrimarina hoheduenensis TaxID=2528000 RepID=A0A5C5W966_9BACT|nr:hypothetical protein [Botrimarina hoheduenensis]TWT46823.1 hypothetical protein Pla111_19250 [Botrimarina hoheduenensis]
MKKNALMLLAVAVTATSLTGCGCCRRLRDTLCRGAYCGGGSAAAIPAPLAMAAPAPMADMSCAYNPMPVAYDAGCGYDPMVQTYGYGSVPMMDSGCPSCVDGSYSMPSYDNGGAYLGSPSTGGMIDPGPAN